MAAELPARLSADPYLLRPERRTLTVVGLLKATARLLSVSPALGRAYAGRVEPQLREAVWVAVSSANQCRYCSFVHENWASRMGLDGETIAALGGDRSGLDGRLRAAGDYLTTWVQADFGTTGPDTAAPFDATFSAAERAALRAVAVLADLSNRTGNTFDAFLDRTRGRAWSPSSLAGELLVAVVFVVANALIVPALMLARRESPGALIRRFRSFAARYSSS